jgi:hypothetical protein
MQDGSVADYVVTRDLDRAVLPRHSKVAGLKVIQAAVINQGLSGDCHKGVTRHQVRICLHALLNFLVETGDKLGEIISHVGLSYFRGPAG